MKEFTRHDENRGAGISFDQCEHRSRKERKAIALVVSRWLEIAGGILHAGTDAQELWAQLLALCDFGLVSSLLWYMRTMIFPPCHPCLSSRSWAFRVRNSLYSA